MAEPYRTRLAGLDPSRYRLPVVSRRLCLLTGQSDFSTSALGGEKLAFLEAVAPAGAEITRLGFPWHEDFAAPPAGPVPIALASLRNARQWIWARRDEAFLAVLTSTMGRLLERTERDLFLVTGSCGIDLLAAALARLAPSEGPAIHLAALGPAGRMPPARRLARRLVLQGSGDGWSRLLWRGPVDLEPACVHLGYWSDPAVRAAVAGFFAEPKP